MTEVKADGPVGIVMLILAATLMLAQIGAFSAIAIVAIAAFRWIKKEERSGNNIRSVDDDHDDASGR